MKLASREAVSAASPSSSPSPEQTEPRRRKTPRATVLLCTLALVGAGLRLFLQSSVYQEWWLSRQPLPGLFTELKRQGESTTLLYYIGLRLDQQGRFDLADGYLRQAVGRDPDTPRLRDEWATALLGSGQVNAAFGELREFAGTHPASAPAHFYLGKFYFTQKSMTRAGQEFERTLALGDDRAEVWAYLSQADDSLGRKSDAMQAARRAAALRPNDARDHLLLASLLSKANQPEAARREFARAAALGPRTAVMHEKYAEWLLNSPADRGLATEEARRAVALDSGDPASQLVLGRALVAAGQLLDAVAPLTRAASLDPNDPAPALALAQVCHRLGQAAESDRWREMYVERQDYAARLRTLQEAVVVHPDDPSAKVRLAHLLGRHGEVDECVHHYAMAWRCAPDSPRALTAAASDLTAGGHADRALPLARRAVQVAHRSPEAREALGDALLALGNTAEAIAEYNRSLAWQPGRLATLKTRVERALAARPTGEPVQVVVSRVVVPASDPQVEGTGGRP